MKNIKLIGLIHGSNANNTSKLSGDTTSGPESDVILARDWFPAIDNQKTLLIVEYGYKEKIININHPAYEEIIKGVSNALFESELGPDILCADTRIKTQELRDRFIADTDAYGEWTNKGIGTSKQLRAYLQTADDVINAVKNKQHHHMIHPPSVTPELLKIIQRVYTAHNKMEQYMLSEAMRHASKYDQVLVLTGAAHSLAMHRVSGFEYHILYDFSTYPKSLPSLFVEFMYVKELAEIVINRGY